MEKPKVYFRADGNSQMGLGHVIRSLALAEMLSIGFECHFIIRNPLTTLKTQILDICSSIMELPEATDHLEEAKKLAAGFQSEDIIVLDGYHFRTEYQQLIKNKGCKLVCIDDIHAYHFVADAVINHAGGISASDYSKSAQTALFLGLKYALLRAPFRNAKKSLENKVDPSKQVLICLGGADPKNHILEVLKTCERSTSIQSCHLIVGAAYAYQKTLDQFIETSNLEIRLYKNISAEKMSNLMQGCGIAITSPSTIAIEYLSIGGSLYLKKIANNQDRIFEYLLGQKLAKAFDSLASQLAPFSVSELALQKAYFDGKQQSRFLKIFQSLLLTTRLATPEDMMLFFDWSNDPSTRKQSFNSKPIPLSEHQKWFNNKINDLNSILYVIELNHIPIAQVRFDTKEGQATISYSIDKNYRGRKLGEVVLQKSMEQFKKDAPEVRQVIGFVKNDNLASQKIFKNLGFSAKPAVQQLDSTQFYLP